MQKYNWENEGKIIRVKNQSTIDIVMPVNDVVSYMNEMARTQQVYRDTLKSLLMMSLDGRNQVRIQDEAAKMLGYPGIDGFINEVYGVNPGKVRKKEERIINDLVEEGTLIDERDKDKG